MSKLTLIALAAIISATAQDRPLVFQVGAELVVLDVIATDAAGREVSDLTSAEVQITEDGSPRPVQQLQVIQPFTSDPELLRRATGRIAAAAAVRTNMDPLFERLDRICNIAGPSDVVNMGVSVGQEIVTEGNRRMVYTTQALAGLAQSLRGMPGRKHIVLSSEGYTLNLVSRVIDSVTAIVSACGDADVLRVRVKRVSRLT